MTCGHTLGASELIPVLSYVFQKGKCKHCQTHVSMQYPLVELLTAFLFAGNFLLTYSLTQSILDFSILYVLSSAILALLVAIFVYDIKHHIIPDQFSFPLASLSVLYLVGTILFLGKNPYWIPDITQIKSSGVTFTDPLALLNISAGIILYLCIYTLWKVSKGRWIGLGDAKLLFGLGTILGFVYGLSAFFLSFWIGTIYVVVVILLQRLSRNSKYITMKSEIAFGPFIIVGFLIVYFFKIDVTNLGFIFQNFL